MTRPFEGIKVVDFTHVLAGPFAAYQLGVLGAEVIKVEHPAEPDQSREMGSDHALNRKGMGTAYLTQGSNKKSLTVNLKTEAGREIVRRLVAGADVMVENYRPGAFESLGLGYAQMKKVNPRLIYCSLTAFGQGGPRGAHTAYDHVIQAASGLMGTTGTPETTPLKVGCPLLDYATGTMAAFALAGALFQRERTGRGQFIDVSMEDVALIMMSRDITSYFWNGSAPQRKGNKHIFATSTFYPTKEGHLMLGATNRRQQNRLFDALGRSDLAPGDSYERWHASREEKEGVIGEKISRKTAREWEEFFQERHIPAARVRTLPEALADPQLETRPVIHEHPAAPGVEGALRVPMAAFTYEHGGPSLEAPPPELGADTEEILGGLGYSAPEIQTMREEGVV